jgi:hypothetical protein
MTLPHLFSVMETPATPQAKSPALRWVENLIGDIRRETYLSATAATECLEKPQQCANSFGHADLATNAEHLLLDRVELLQAVATAAAVYVDEAAIGNLLALRDALILLELHRAAFPS